MEIEREGGIRKFIIQFYLPQVVEWDDDGQVAGEKFKDGKNGVQHPVGQPFGVIIFGAGF